MATDTRIYTVKVEDVIPSQLWSQTHSQYVYTVIYSKQRNAKQHEIHTHSLSMSIFQIAVVSSLVRMLRCVALHQNDSWSDRGRVLQGEIKGEVLWVMMTSL